MTIRADHSSYFIAIYIQTETTWKRKDKRKMRRKKRQEDREKINNWNKRKSNQ